MKPVGSTMGYYWFLAVVLLVFTKQVSPKVAVPPFKTTVELIQAEGYPAESHFLTTSDGYILNFHRIPYGKNTTSNGKVVFFQHALLCSSSYWLLNTQNNVLAYILADGGYDVWLGNFRGNMYSRNHTTLNPDKDNAFWDFSFHEMGLYDIPAGIDYILNVTGVQKLYYIGHSMGTTAFYIMGSERQEYMEKIKFYVHLGPEAYVKRMFCPFCQVASNWWKEIEILFRLFNINEVGRNTKFFNGLITEIASTNIGYYISVSFTFTLIGFNYQNMNRTTFPNILQYLPAGASIYEVLHYFQLISSGRFQQYDFGVSGNLRRYGTLFPPMYNLEKITAPGHLFYAKNDWLASISDVEKTAAKVGNLSGKTLVSDSKFNHLDFIFGINVRDMVYNKLVELLNNN